MELRFFLRNDLGVTSIEYALIATLIALVCVSAITTLGQKAAVLYVKVDNALS